MLAVAVPPVVPGDREAELDLPQAALCRAALDEAVDDACTPRIPHPRNPAVRAALDLLEADPGHPWTLAELADRVYLLRSQLVRAFRTHLGVTPMGHLREARLRAMAVALRTTNASATNRRPTSRAHPDPGAHR